ncbi:hypothetical protein M427DRAFT_305302 [Gonapodya prolifera JEL478]|uniref:Uncharacterized protein n=1 Tax=Gonapodya prolifera (strain JEL478) TaxID=1344416 RepID=A0A139AHN1_GONPJ|nr:hypothetical protein M427DRAFT_305302 [Gonapodya prolifera JEL478]|eukprot:KXS15923.1 hypothetical protein M427DRAFT_305302 [Gonapodya prolifera JEL478]
MVTAPKASPVSNLAENSNFKTPDPASSAGGVSGQAAESLQISRNKHFPYIASYHGPWLSLPIDLLQSLFSLNAESVAVPVAGKFAPTPGHGDGGPPPIDTQTFRNLIAIRKLVDDASELVIKAAGGGTSSNPLGIPMGPLGLGTGGPHSNGSQRISHVRQHRLRELAVQKLAKAYRIDEVATSVLTMQSASALDEVGMKVIKKNPHSADALYVHFFHEKIPSRMLAASTTTDALDRIVQQNPTIAEYYRTRAMVRGFREEFPLALRDWRMAIQLVKKRRKAAQAECEKASHSINGDSPSGRRSKGGGGNLSSSSNGNATQAPATPYNQSASTMGVRPVPIVVNWDEDLDQCSEAQLYFLRGACYHQYAVSLIDRAVRGVNERLVLGLAEAVQMRKKRKGKKKAGAGKAAGAQGSIEGVAGSQPARISQAETHGSGESVAKESHTMATLTPSTSYLPSDVVMAPPATYQPALEPLAAQVAQLVRRSIRDHVHFLSFFPNSLPPFLHPSMPSLRDDNRSGADDNARPNSPTVSPPSPSADSGSGAGGSSTAAAQATTFPEFLHSIPAQSLSISDGPPPSPPASPSATSSSALVPRGGGSGNATTLAQLLQSQQGGNGKPGELPNLGTYHPLLVEAWYAIGLNYLILGDWYTAMMWHERTTRMNEIVEGYPVFLPARSMSQADYVEIVSRMKKIVGQNRRVGPRPTAALSLPRGNGKPVLAIRDKEHEDDALTGSEGTIPTSRSNTPSSSEEDKDPDVGISATAKVSPAAERAGHSDGSDVDASDSSVTGTPLASSTSSDPTGKLPPRRPSGSDGTPGIKTGATSGSSSGSGAAPGGSAWSSSSSGNFRTYPLHTKRADNVLLWLQAFVVPLGEIIDHSPQGPAAGKKKSEGAGDDEDGEGQV